LISPIAEKSQGADQREFGVLFSKPPKPNDNLKVSLDDRAWEKTLKKAPMVDWEGWVSILLEQLEDEAKRRRIQVANKEMVSSLFQGLAKY
jgi:hypothetical protein